MRTKYKTTLACFAFTVVICVISSAAHAATMRWCGRWKTQYTDAGNGEDVFTSTALTDRTSRYSKAHVFMFNGFGWYTVWSGNLDSDGCSPDLTYLPSTIYVFRQLTFLERGDRKIRILPKGRTSWAAVSPYFDNWYLSSPIWQPGAFTHTFPGAGMTEATGLASIASKFLEQADTLDYPNGTTTWLGINESANVCPGGSHYADYVNGVHRVCVPFASDRKFLVVHELGHAVSRENNGPRRGEYSADETTNQFMDTDTDHRCDCTISQPTSAVGSHCLNSREFIGSGAKEGFSHFLAAATFNSRDQNTNGGGFAYYKNVLESPTYPDPDPDNIHIAPFPVNVTNDETWMESECDPTVDGFENLGTEWDWISFFWNLWTIGDDRFDVDEINTAWNLVPDWKAIQCCAGTNCYFRPQGGSCAAGEDQYSVGKVWADVNGHVMMHWGEFSGEAIHFNDMGSNAGVDY